jgi:hypothetical protein
VNHYNNQQVPFMHGNNYNVLRTTTRQRSGSLVSGDPTIPLKPNQVGVNPLEMSRKTIDYHKPAGTLSQLARENLKMTIQQY